MESPSHAEQIDCELTHTSSAPRDPRPLFQKLLESYMQEFHPIPGLAGRLFGGSAAAAAPAPEEVRCPRCDSANTKFCYYNNYNLSQPRHFCKACRRYWTKGGLLRNVPVGGGCRKPKRPAPTASAADDSCGGGHAHHHRDAKNARSAAGCCTGGDSSRTRTPAAAPAPASNASSAATQPCVAGATVTTNVTVAADPLPLPPLPAPLFADQATAFASLFAPLTPPPPPPLHPLPALKSYSAQPKGEEDAAPALTPMEQPSAASVATEGTAPSFAARSGGLAVASAPEWLPTTVLDAGMFDLAGSIGGDTSYWNPASWTDDPDGTIYLP